MPVALFQHGNSGSLMCMQVAAVDADSGINAKITYSIEHVSDSTIIQSCCGVDRNSGEVRLITALVPEDVNATYVVTVIATDAGTQPLSTTVRLCMTVVDRNMSGDHLRSPAHGWLTTGRLAFDVTIMSALLGSSMLCAFIIIVICVMILMQRRTRTHRNRHLNHHGKNPSHYRLVEVWNSTQDEEMAEKRQPVNNDNEDIGGHSNDVPRTIICTLERSPRSSRNADVRIQRSRVLAPMFQGNSSTTRDRNKPDGSVNVNHFDVEPPPHTASSNV